MDAYSLTIHVGFCGLLESHSRGASRAALDRRTRDLFRGLHFRGKEAISRFLHPSDSRLRSAVRRTGPDYISNGHEHRDAYKVAQLSAPADFVFMANAFHGVPDRVRLAQSVKNALKADGSFVIVNWHKRPREETPILGEPRGPKTELRMSPEETIKSVEGQGLKFTKTVEVPPYHYGVVFDRSGA